MDDVDDAVHVRVLALGGALPIGEVRQIRHEARDEALEKGHHQHDLHRRQIGDEQPNVLQIPIHGQGVRIRRGGMGREGKPSQHPRVVVTDFLAEVVLDDRPGLVGRDGEMGGGHPVDEVPFKHGGVARDERAAFIRNELLRVRKGGDELADRPVDVFLNRRGERSLVGHHKRTPPQKASWPRGAFGCRRDGSYATRRR